MEAKFAYRYITIGNDLLDRVNLESGRLGMTVDEFMERLVEDYFASTEALEQEVTL